MCLYEIQREREMSLNEALIIKYYLSLILFLDWTPLHVFFPLSTATL